MSKDSFLGEQNVGATKEKKYSKMYHGRCVPLLISPLVLRDYQCSQIDVSWMEKCLAGSWKIHLLEVKSGRRIGGSQLRRLKNSAKLLGLTTGVSVRVWGAFGCQTRICPLG